MRLMHVYSSELNESIETLNDTQFSGEHICSHAFALATWQF